MVSYNLINKLALSVAQKKEKSLAFLNENKSSQKKILVDLWWKWAIHATLLLESFLSKNKKLIVVSILDVAS